MPNKKTDEIGNLFGHPKEYRSYNLSSSLVQPRTLIGVEVEIEGMRDVIDTLNSNRKVSRDKSMHRDTRGNWKLGSGFWNVKTDGSLRNYGVEFVTDKLFGEDLLHALD